MHCCPAFVPTFLPRVTATLPFPSTPVEASTLDFPLALLADDFTVVHDATSTFEPVLNVPALVSFLIIAVVFVGLQSRINALQEASERRTAALDRLRAVKADELAGEADCDTVAAAVKDYRKAFEQAEQLRTIVRGVRLLPPPGESLTRERMKENAVAAKQFLGVDLEPATAEERNMEQHLSLPLVVLLGFLALSQLCLLGLLLIDPMSSNDVFDTLDTLTGME